MRLVTLKGLMALAISVSVTGAAAAQRGILDYKVYFGGFAAVGLEIDLARARDDYRIGAKLRTLGVVDQFFSWSMQSYSRGRLQGTEARPEAAGHTSDWRGRQRLVDIRYEAGRPVVRRLTPKPESDDRVPVSADDIPGTVDLASAVLSMTLAAEAGRPCGQRVPVFDGRRRYDLVAERIGVETIRWFGRAGHVRDAVKCRVSMERISGFKKPTDSDEHGDADPSDTERRFALVWLAPAGHGMPPVPIRVEVETRWGLIVGHLVKVRPAPADAE